MEKTRRNNQKGITLIALVITIIVLIILAGISIMMISGQDGILSRAGNAKEINIAGQEKEQIQLAYSAALIDTKGTKITAENFQTELNKYAEATVTENADGSFNIVFTKTNNSYTFDSGNFVEGSGSSINWEEILADANSNPDKYKSEDQSSTNGDIGIGTDGKPVNLDLWTYRIINGNEISLSRVTGCVVVAGYDKNNIVNGQIIGKVPQYIKIDGKNEFYQVTDMKYTFYKCSNLTTAPEIPNSVTSMSNTFDECSNLTTAPEIPNSVTDMKATFYGCSSLTTAPEIPNSVTDMTWTFNGCSSLTTAPEIPNSVTNMNNTFYECSNLTTAPEIPDSVTDMSGTFYGCSSLTTAPEIPNYVTDLWYTFCACYKLEGIIVINANPTRYADCFLNAATKGSGLKVTGSSNKLDELIATGDSNYIKKGK